MEKRKVFARVLLITLVLIGIFHLCAQFVVYGTGIRGFGEKGISGFSVGKNDVGEEIKQAPRAAPVWSKVALAGEWILIAFMLLTVFAQRRMKQKMEVGEFHIEEAVKQEINVGMKTDLDCFYSVLTERKTLKLSEICNLFNVDKEIALSWCRTLESGELAEINYPFMGEPEVALKVNKQEEGR